MSVLQNIIQRTDRTSRGRASLMTPLMTPLLTPLFTMLLTVVLGLGMGLSAGRASAQVLDKQVPAKARGLDVVEHLGATLPMDLEFVNSKGDTVKLGTYFSPALKADGTPNGATGRARGLGKPIVVAMVYYSCETACSVVLSKMSESFGTLDYKVGRDFDVLTFSFKEEEKTSDAAAAKSRYIDALTHGSNDPGIKSVTSKGWEFHTGSVEACQTLADALGFQYRKLDNGEYSHPISIFVVTPEGRISRYVYGFDYDPGIMKMALLEASNGAIAKSITDRFLHLCYKYDPTAGVYTLQAFRVMQIGGMLGMVGIALLILTLRFNEMVKRRRERRAGYDPRADAIRRREQELEREQGLQNEISRGPQAAPIGTNISAATDAPASGLASGLTPGLASGLAPGVIS